MCSISVNADQSGALKKKKKNSETKKGPYAQISSSCDNSHFSSHPYDAVAVYRSRHEEVDDVDGVHREVVLGEHAHQAHTEGIRFEHHQEKTPENSPLHHQLKPARTERDAVALSCMSGQRRFFFFLFLEPPPLRGGRAGQRDRCSIYV